MPELYRNKYRIASSRLQMRDYGQPGMFFITICTAHRQCFFGEIQNRKMQLSEIGTIAESEWLKTKTIRPDMNLELGEFVIMPNHVHGIIVINENKYNRPADDDCRDAMHRVSTIETIENIADETITQPNDKPINQFQPQSKNLASILRGYKSAVTTYARKHGITFNWQARYHDRVIRSKDEYIRIARYIVNNPSKWERDRFHPER